jgi:LysR family transcriptional activator of nhaA
VFRYADEIFTLGKELRDAMRGRPVRRPMSLIVGVADVVPKLVARRLLEPALKLPDPVHLVCREDKPEALLTELAVHNLDIVLSDSPINPSIRVRAFNHLLGECGVVLFGTAKLAAAYRRGFPKSLDGAPLILPTENTTLRRALDQWFAARDIRPQIVGEFEDSALMKVFGQAGMGLFPVSSIIADEARRQYEARPVGTLHELRERFYAISIERKLKHPAVIAISQEARQTLFG